MDKILDKIESEYEVIQNFEEYIQRQCIRKKLEQDMYNNLNKKSVDEMEKWRK